MADFITGLRQVIQDLVAPDLKAILTNQEATQKQIALQHDAVMKTLEAFRAEMRAELTALRANNQLEVLRQLAPLSEGVAVIEKGRQ